MWRARVASMWQPGSPCEGRPDTMVLFAQLGRRQDIMKKHQFAATAALTLMAAIPAEKSLAGQVIVGNYYEDKIDKTCNNSYYCIPSYPITPSNKFVTVENISCFVDSTQALRIAAFGATSSPGGTTGRSTYISFMANFSGGNGRYYYNISQPMKYKIAPSRYPFVDFEVSSPGNIYLSCIFSGTLSDN